MRPSAHSLAMRDPALAAVMGALPGTDFGRDPRSYGRGPMPRQMPMARPMPRRAPRPAADFGYGFGYDYGAEGGAPAAAPMARGHHPEMVRAWHHHHQLMGHTAARAALLDPNENSLLKIERYSFSLTNSFTLGGTGTPLVDMTLQPNTKIRPQRVVMNAPSPNFVLLSGLQVANVNAFVGDLEDAFTYSALAQGVALDLPTLEPANRLTVSGNYTGFIPPGFATGFPFTFIATVQGPSTIAGGGGC
jgi:hypothetical protein